MNRRAGLKIHDPLRASDARIHAATTIKDRPIWLATRTSAPWLRTWTWAANIAQAFMRHSRRSIRL